LWDCCRKNPLIMIERREERRGDMYREEDKWIRRGKRKQ
jgi:hypothetical protein